MHQMRLAASTSGAPFGSADDFARPREGEQQQQQQQQQQQAGKSGAAAAAEEELGRRSANDERLELAEKFITITASKVSPLPAHFHWHYSLLSWAPTGLQPPPLGRYYFLERGRRLGAGGNRLRPLIDGRATLFTLQELPLGLQLALGLQIMLNAK